MHTHKSKKLGHRILVVDDEPSVRRSIKMLLQHDGHDVKTADGGDEALALFKPGQFDLVMTDYSMSDMKGTQLAALIRECAPKQRIIMATAFAEQFHDAGPLPIGVDALLSKPFSLAELRAAIAKALSQGPGECH